MDMDCDIILNKVRARMRSVYVRNAIKHYARWREHGHSDFDSIRLDKYGSHDVNLRISELEDSLFKWQDMVGTRNLEIQRLQKDIQALMSTRDRKWWQFWK